MNLALGAVLLLLLVSPGFFYLAALHSGSYSRLNFSKSIPNQIFISLIPNLIIHSFGLVLINKYSSYTVDLSVLYGLMNGSKDLNKEQFQIISDSFLMFSFYIFFTNVLGAVSGKLTRVSILKFGLDLKFRALRIHNEWYYLLYGKILDFPEVPGSSDDIDYIQIDALVLVGDQKVIYKGFLDRFYLDKDQGLDRVVLYFVFRRFLEADESKADKNKEGGILNDERYYEMPGDFLVIPYDKIINMNISYKQYVLGGESSDMQDLDWDQITRTVLSLDKT